MQSTDTPNPLVGTWKLVSFQFESEGSDERFDAYDEHPEGFAFFTEARAFFLLTAGDRLAAAPASELFDRSRLEPRTSKAPTPPICRFSRQPRSH